jgi:hypothetical protein
MNRHHLLTLGSLALLAVGTASGLERERIDRFRQLEEILPSPNDQRAASGAPGHEYWQQEVDYVIDVKLDEEQRRLEGAERITYRNHSPDTLRYLWVQLDQNRFRPDSHSVLTSLDPDPTSATYGGVRRALERSRFPGGQRILAVVDASGEPLPHTINDTMMRVDLAEPLAPGGSVTLSIAWEHRVIEQKVLGGRSGYEHFEEDGNDLYEIAQWFPRLCAYTDVNGWQNKQFLGSGEFTLEFGDYEVHITVPADHVVASTGVLQNPGAVLTEAQRARLEEARTAERPMFVITPEEALANESSRSEQTRTWVFKAEDVRDFAWASSRKFIWDAQGTRIGDRDVMAMSYYPKEGEPLWSRYSTHAILHTLEVYGRQTIPYPYPVAISVNGPVGGMEYPMICFNGPRPEEDGTYSERTKYGLISVIIHEVGHNWFPMIINSDERQWTWMDEGLNTFVQFLAEQEWEEDYPSWRGEARRITGYMAADEIVPIMTNSESLLQFGNNAYAKPATALNVLRETVMGRELFDFAFREYSRRWAFRRPQPADLFRTLEDASAVDLDWFWRGWFYTTDHVDLAIEGVTRYRIDTRDPDIEKPRKKAERAEEPESPTERRNRMIARRMDSFPELADFYNEYDELDVTVKDREQFQKLLDDLEGWERELLASDLRFYAVDLQNLGGIPMPVILELEYADGEREELRLPAEVWVRDSEAIRKVVISERDVVAFRLDPHLETADTDTSNNAFPPEIADGTMRLEAGGRRRRQGRGEKNPMQEAREAAERAAEAPPEEPAPTDAGDGR